MRELSIKEKASRYDEAIEVARKFRKDCKKNRWVTECMENIFPELKESEDERIRKELLEHCKNQAKPYIQTGNECPQIQSWIDWLEKQGEKKPVCSEEDEKMVRALMSICDEWATRHSYLPKEDNDIEKIKSWLKSHKLKNNITEEELDKARKDAFKDAFYHSGDPTFNDGWWAAIDYIQKKFL